MCTPNSKEVVFRDGTVSVEQELPLPIVLYPGFYGAFFGFSNTPDSDIFFCSCAERAIRNYIRFRGLDDIRSQSDPDRKFILSKDTFPQRFVRQLIAAHTPSEITVLNKIEFKDKICHECNRVTPQGSYCDAMYGGVFEQNYGWYINKQSLEYGVLPVSFKILEDVCPDKVFCSLDIGKKEFLDVYNRLTATELLITQASDKALQKHVRKMRNIIENEVRVKFGFNKIGDAWASETLLYQIVSEVLPGEKIVRHFRHQLLGNLELDIFIPSINTGIEYQGIQHYEPVEHWGGQEALKQVKERDKKKKELCSKHGIRLIYFYYSEELSKALVKERLNVTSGS